MSNKGKLLYYGVLLAVALTAPLLLADEPLPASDGDADAVASAKGTASAGTTSTPGPVPQAKAKVVDSAARQAKEALVTIEADTFRATLSNLNTGLARFELKGDRYRTDGNAINMVTTDKEAFLPLSFELDGVDIDPNAVWTATSQTADRASFEWQGDGVVVRREFRAGDGPYQLWVTTKVENRGDKPRTIALTTRTFHYVAKSSEKGPLPFLPVQSPDRSSGLCYHGEDVEREDGKSLTDEPVTFDKPRFAATENVYFLQALAPSPDAGAKCRLSASERGRDADGDPLGTLFEVRLSQTPATVAPGESVAMETLAYLGPKTPRELEKAGHGLVNAIDTGWFSILAKLLTTMLRWLYELIGNWGVAIMVLTFAVNALLYPLTAKQTKSMARMKELKPEMDRINELYADDREKKGAAVMELYKKKGVNPMAGCFPMLIQLPIWFSLYTSLSTNVELFRAPFALWWTDLASPDPYFVLPLGLGVLMFVQQKITPATAADPLQQKMMLYMMPTMITSFMLFLPAGLCLYMFTNSALRIGQQRLIELQLTKAGYKPRESSSSQPQSDDADEGDNKPAQRLKPSRPSKAERRSRRGK